MNAERIEQQAAEWLARRERADWSADDQGALDAWLDADTAHKLAYWRLEHGWAKVGRLAALRGAVAASRSRRWRPAAIAAAIGAIALAGVVLFIGLPRDQQRYETPVGGHGTMPLADGSRVELSTDTRVRAAVTEARREVWLDRGEAYFEVQHDRSRPFVVWAGDRKVTVLGTKFSVRRDGDQVRVAVLEGRVQVAPAKPADDADAQIAVRGDIVLAKGASTLLSSASTDQVARALSWRRGMLTFDRTTLAEAAAEFNRYSTTKLVLDDEETAAIRIGGTFQSDNAVAFARLLGDAYGLHVVEHDDEIVISR